MLNALLYGNSRQPQENDKQPESPNRGGRNRSKPVPLPKGVKAIMSPKPGETKEITFYELSAVVAKSKDTPTTEESGTCTTIKSDSQTNKNKVSLWLADLPGYGFAYASHEMATAYQELMATYLCHPKEAPRRLLLLLDARHGMKQTDRVFLQNLQQQRHDLGHRSELPSMQVVLTKCDLVDAVDLARRVVQVQDDLHDVLRRQTSRLPVLLTSATKQNGILAVQKELASLVVVRR